MSMMGTASATPGGLRSTATAGASDAAATAAALGHVDDTDCNDDDDDETSSITCPLFMDGLPSNFSDHPHLAAIASLLEDTVPEEIELPNDGDGRSDQSFRSHHHHQHEEQQQQHQQRRHGRHFDSIIQKKKWQRDTIAAHYRSQRRQTADGGNAISRTPRTNGWTVGGGKTRPPPSQRRSHPRGYSPYPTAVASPPAHERQSWGENQNSAEEQGCGTNRNNADVDATSQTADSRTPKSATASVGEATLFLTMWKL